MKAIDRLYQYLELIKMRPTRFEKEAGLSNGYLRVQKKRNADLGESIFNKIIEYSTDLNPLWLLTGKGNMLNEEKELKSDAALISYEDILFYLRKNIDEVIKDERFNQYLDLFLAKRDLIEQEEKFDSIINKFQNKT